MNAEEIWEEIICDSLGDMNIFAPVELLGEMNSEFLSNLKEEVKKNAKSERGPPANVGKMSREYENADINTDVLDLVSKVKQGKYKDNDDVTLKSPTKAVLDRLSEIMDVDYSGYKVVVEARQINHILKDHGENGKTDQSMRNDQDIAKIEYTLSSPDSIEKAGKTQAYSYMLNGYNRTADTVRYEKSIGDTSYYVIQAVPVANKKTLYIVSAFIGKSGYKKGTSQLIDAKSLNATAEHGSVVVPNNSIPQKSDLSTESEKKVSSGKASREIEAEHSDYNKPITISDIETLRSIGRKSINQFTDGDIKKAQKWAYKFYQELGTKSPFFRAWFGEWRSHDKSRIAIVQVPTIDIAQVSLPNGNYTISDTGWDVYAGKTLNDDTRHHSGGNRINIKALNSIETILQNSILLDTIVSERDSKKKSSNTAFLHKLYTPIFYDGRTYIAKTTVEEFYNETINNVSRRAYNLKAIKIEPAGGQLGNVSSSSRPDASSINSISDLYEFVKGFDKDFSPAHEVSDAVLNADGTPKVLYHQTSEDFTEFDAHHKGAGTNDDETPFGIFMKPSDTDIGLKGKKQMALYARIINPLVATDRTNLVKQIKALSNHYGELVKQREALSVEYHKKIDDATQAWSQYAKEYRATYPDANRAAIYDDAEFRKLYDAEDILTEEWIKKADDLSLQMKEEITQTLKMHGYDGVILKKDVGSGGRVVETYIALESTQVKSATDNIGTFDKSNPDIRFSRELDVEEMETTNTSKPKLSNRAVLANALMSATQGPAERENLAKYQADIAKIDELEEHLAEVNAEIKALSFTKGADRSKLSALYDDKVKTTNRITTYDRRLLSLEANEALKNLLTREKQKAYKKAAQEGREAISSYRNQRTKTETRHKIKKVVNELNQYLLNGTKDKHVPIELQRPVAEALAAVNMDTVGADPRVARYNDLIAQASLCAEDTHAVHNKFSAFSYYEVTVRYKSEVYSLYLNVGKGINDNKYHIYDITKKIRDTANRINGLGRPVGYALENGISSKSISQNGEVVNTEILFQYKMPLVSFDLF